MTDYKNDNWEKLMQPKYFFATLRTEQAYLICNRSDQDFKFKSTDGIKISEAIEATDLVWENRHYSHLERKCYRLTVFLIMAALTFGVFVLFVWLIKIKLRVSFIKSPPGIECKNVLNSYESDLQ